MFYISIACANPANRLPGPGCQCVDGYYDLSYVCECKWAYLN